MAVDVVLMLCVSPALSAVQSLHSTNTVSLSMSHSKCSACVVCFTVCSTQFQRFMAVDAVPVLCVSPSCDNTTVNVDTPLNGNNKHCLRKVTQSTTRTD